MNDSVVCFASGSDDFVRTQKLVDRVVRFTLGPSEQGDGGDLQHAAGVIAAFECLDEVVAMPSSLSRLLAVADL